MRERKLRLSLDALEVQSFGVEEPIAIGGVHEVFVGVAKTEGSCGAPDCKTEPAICPP
ncbi:MAG TPA: hypothetical protein VFQ39_15120 [Longimicrobium sp.]|nr:hypothetical protein [Longimicrobium sp.]